MDHSGGVREEEFTAAVEADIAGAELGVRLQLAELAAPVDPGVQLGEAEQVVARKVRIADVGGDETEFHPERVALGADALDAADGPETQGPVTERLGPVLLLVQDDFLSPSPGRSGLFLADRRTARGHALRFGGPGQRPEHAPRVIGQHLVDHADQARPVGLRQEGPLDVLVQAEVGVERVEGGCLDPVEIGLRRGAPAKVHQHRSRGGIGMEARHEQEGRGRGQIGIGR